MDSEPNLSPHLNRVWFSPRSGLDLIMYFIAGTLFFIVTWPILSSISSYDVAGRTPFVLGIITIAYAGNHLRNKYVIILGLLCFYTILNMWVKNDYKIEFIEVSSLALPFLAFCSSFALFQKDKKVLLLISIFSLLSLILFMISKTSFSFRGFSAAEQVVVDDSIFNSNATGLYLSVFSSIFVIAAIFFKIPIFVELFVYGIVFLLVIPLASRSSMYCLCISLFFSYIIYSNKISKSKFIFITVFALLLIIVVQNFIMNETFLGERILSTDTQIKRKEYSGTFISNIFGDRAMYYYDGWQIFTEHPISGVGNNNYIKYNSFGPFVCHVEIMKQFSENGIIGVLLLFSFFLFALTDAAKAFFTSKYKDIWLSYFQAIPLILAICSTAYISSRVPYYLLLGISCSYFSQVQKKQ